MNFDLSSEKFLYLSIKITNKITKRQNHRNLKTSNIFFLDKNKKYQEIIEFIKIIIQKKEILSFLNSYVIKSVIF
jgi:hypothetical protein